MTIFTWEIVPVCALELADDMGGSGVLRGVPVLLHLRPRFISVGDGRGRVTIDCEGGGVEGVVAGQEGGRPEVLPVIICIAVQGFLLLADGERS